MVDSHEINFDTLRMHYSLILKFINLCLDPAALNLSNLMLT